MKDELLSIANDALNAIDEFENYLFANHRAKYAMSKSILDQHREHITQIKKGLELDLDDAGFDDVRSDLNLIIDNVNSARNGSYELEEPNIDTTEVEQMLDSLKEERVETEYPTADINVDGINNAINTLETTEGMIPPADAVVTAEPQNDGMTDTTMQPMMEQPPVDAMVVSESQDKVIADTTTQVPLDQQSVGNIPPQMDVNMVPQMDMSSDIDINALDAFMNTQTQQ